MESIQPKKTSLMVKRLSLLVIILFSFASCISLQRSKNKASFFTDPRDNQTYKTIKIGYQSWMAENLNFNSQNGSWCYFGEVEYCENYGRLYDYVTALSACPDGWHLPTIKEWKKLRRAVGFSSSRLKSESEGWRAPTMHSNTSGFSAIGSGMRDSEFYEGAYYVWRLIDVQARYWCFSANSNRPHTFTIAWHNYVWSSEFSLSSPQNGLAVRCIQDKK